MIQVLIADDEPVEVKALEMMVHHDFPEMDILPSAVNGPDLLWKIEKFHPDIVITDINMPGMNGLEVCETIRSRYPEMKILVCTAYSDFQYLKRAMDLGASDYVLKPVSREAFAQTLKRTVEALQDEQQRAIQAEGIRRDLDEMHRIAGDELLSSLLLGEPSENSFEILVRALPHTFYGSEVMTVRFGDEDRGLQRQSARQRLQTMRQTLQRYCSCIGRVYRDEHYFLIFPSMQMDEKYRQNWLTDMAQMVRSDLVRAQMDGGAAADVTFGFGAGAGRSAEELLNVLEESRLAARGHHESGIYFYRDKERVQTEDPLAGGLHEMQRAIERGDEKDVKRRVDAVFASPQVQEMPINELRSFLLQDLSKLLPQSDSLLSLYLPGQRLPWTQLHDCSSVQELQEWTIKMTGRMCRLQSDTAQVNEYIVRALLYMKAHFAEDISLDMTAEKAGVSSFYLSRLFKQELQRTFVELLTDMRMEKALRLISSGEYPVRVIAQMTGYRNVTYFYKVFRKYVGISVSDLKGGSIAGS